MLCWKPHADIGLDASKIIDFDIEDKEPSGAPKNFEDKDLEAFLHEDSWPTQAELAES